MAVYAVDRAACVAERGTPPEDFSGRRLVCVCLVAGVGLQIITQAIDKYKS